MPTAIPTVTLLFASLHALLLMVLVVPIVLHRRRARIGLGDGGDARLARRMRVQANFNEYVPLALVLLALLEMSRVPGPWIWAFGSVLLAGRILHAVGLSGSAGVSRGRFFGTLLTWVDLLAMAGVGVWLTLIPS
ncbi:MAPEG family protein [Luteimonas vadosa]|uniref:MAPEG family protein n=1 Tax=Luteimonas vadosa TaxID=1165507 RepID=A0ABP9E9H2_9GAMM